ncbi:MAG: PEP-CTERM sorting domain-containing protein [Deltaproteobacteria bacterium]|nr:PEP-CTERM sorting domain-containing protein [Deltaproteobacteria bacterium]
MKNFSGKMVSRLAAGVFAVLVIFCFLAGSAEAVSTVTARIEPYGEQIGLRDAGYYNGIYIIDIDGKDYQAMLNLPDLPLIGGFGMGNSTDFLPFQAELYDFADIQATGGPYPDRITASEYNQSADVFVTALLGYNPPDPLWAAGLGDCLWESIYGTIGAFQGDPTLSYSSRVYDTSTGMTMYDAYKTLWPLNPNMDWSGDMWVLSEVQGVEQNFFVFATPVGLAGGAPVPEPASLFLIGTGIVGILAIRSSKKRWQ